MPATEREQLRTQLDKPYVYEGEETPEYDSLVVNLGMRQLLIPNTLDGVLDVVLNRVDYGDAPERIKRNRVMLTRPRVRERLLELLGMVARSGAHVTMHELLGFFSFVITAGQSSIEQVTSILPYHDLIFDKGNPLARWLRSLDPAEIAHPLVDMWLWDGDPEGCIEWLETPGEVVPQSYEDSQQAIEVFTGLKRRYYFEAKEGGTLLALIPEDRRTFYELLDESETARDTATIRILDALSHFFGADGAAGQQNRLQIWTALRYEAIAHPTAFVSSQSVSADDVELLVPRLRPQAVALLEYEPSQVTLVVRPRLEGRGRVNLTLDLELWLALTQLQRGMPQRHHDPVIGRRLNQFMSRLAAQYQEVSSGYVQLQVRNVESGETYQINISLERGRYL